MTKQIEISRNGIVYIYPVDGNKYQPDFRSELSDLSMVELEAAMPEDERDALLQSFAVQLAKF